MITLISNRHKFTGCIAYQLCDNDHQRGLFMVGNVSIDALNVVVSCGHLQSEC